MFKKDYTKLLEKSLEEIEALNYSEQFLGMFPDFFAKHFPVTRLSLFVLSNKKTEFEPFYQKGTVHPVLLPIDWNSNLVIYLKNSGKTVVFKDEKPSRVRFLKKSNEDFFDSLDPDVVIPLFSLKKLYGFVVISATGKFYKELEAVSGFFNIFANILIPLVNGERSVVENNRNYYKIYRMDRLAMVGELAASAAHEIKNPLAGISTFLKYFTELTDFKKADIIDELNIMRQSVQRIDEIIKSLLSFSRYKKKKIEKVDLAEITEASLQSIALKIPRSVTITKNFDEALSVETDSQQLQQVLINILFNSAEAIGKAEGEITISTYVSGRDQLPSQEMFNISVKDNGPGIPEDFKEKIFQPFQTTKEEGTGLGLYTCYGLMKSLGGSIKINSSERGTEVILSMHYSFDEEAEE